MYIFSALVVCLSALTASNPTGLERRQAGAGANVNLNANVNMDINRLIDQISELAEPDLSEGKPWSYQQQTSLIMNYNEKIYVDCIKSGAANKGCPAEYPWNQEGCFFWLTGGGVSWRRCNKRQTGYAYWDAGSSLRRLYESPPLNSSPELWEKFMTNPKRFDVINKVRF